MLHFLGKPGELPGLYDHVLYTLFAEINVNPVFLHHTRVLAQTVLTTNHCLNPSVCVWENWTNQVAPFCVHSFLFGSVSFILPHATKGI